MISSWVVLFRLVLAAVLSGIVGFEREFHGRAAGFRTHILLCVGSTLIMLTSMHIFDVYAGRVACDPARIAAGVITGIGFLGAGAIMRSRASVRGLTTASSLWVMTGVGLAVGSGFYFGAIVTTVITIVALMLFGRIEYAMIHKDWYKTVVVTMRAGTDCLQRVREILAEYEAQINDFEIEPQKDSSDIRVSIGVKLSNGRHIDAVIGDISRLEGVKHAKWSVE